MEIIFRPMSHTQDEIVMGQKIWFPESVESDVVSATANASGFTPLTAIARTFDWDREMIVQASMACNERGEVAVLDKLSPKLLLVPKSNGSDPVEFLIKDLIAAANAVKGDVLNFTHFGFVQSKLPQSEIDSILDVMMHPSLKTTLRVTVWDIDFRFRRQMVTMWTRHRHQR